MILTIGWWAIPAILTIAAWIPTLRYKPMRGDYVFDFAVVFYAAGSLIATLLVWLIYFAIGWSLA